MNKKGLVKIMKNFISLFSLMLVNATNMANAHQDYIVNDSYCYILPDEDDFQDDEDRDE